MDKKEDKKQVLPEGQEPVNEQKPTAKELFYGKVREAYPDDEIGDEAIYERAGELLAGLQDYKGTRADIDGKLREIFEADPKVGALFAELVEGKKPFRAILASQFSPEDLTPQEGDDDYDAYAKVLEERKQSFAEMKEKEAKMLENIENSEKVFVQFCADKGLDEEKAGKFREGMMALLEDMQDGLLKPQFLEVFLKGLEYDQDVKVAEVKGRNAKIQEKIQEKPKGDGLPDTSGASKETVKDTATDPNKEWLKQQLGGRKRVL